jgi:hypothetical protein
MQKELRMMSSCSLLYSIPSEVDLSRLTLQRKLLDIM